MPTALELTPAEWRRYTQTASRQLNTDALFGDARGLSPDTRSQLMTQLRKAARILKEDFRVRRVILFGSLAHEAWLLPDSDVDLAVEGLAPTDYWEAWRRIETIISDRPVDLIEIESASPSILQMLDRHGIQL